MAQAPGFMDRLRSLIGGKQTAVTDPNNLVTGMFKLGSLGTFSGQAWYYHRVVNAVYHNPTGKRCVDAISAAFARAPLKCYKPGDEVREVAVKSPLQMLLDNPVPDGLGVQAASGKAAARKRARDLTLAGMSLTLKVRGDGFTSGPITQLRRLPPQRCTVIGNEHDEQLGFIYWDRLGNRVPLLRPWCIYEHFSHPDRDFWPFPPALAAGLAAETDNRAARFNLDLLENDGAIPAVVMLEGLTPGDFDEWVAKWEQNEDPGKVRFMGFKGTPAGGKSVELVRIGQTNQELAYDKLRDYSRDDMRRALGCPPVVAFDLSGETYANADAELKHWYANTIWDYWDQSADEMTAQLGSEYNVELGYDYSLIPELQESKDSMVKRFMTLQQNENVAINYTNDQLGLPHVPWGDEPVLPMTAMAPQPPPPATEEPPEPPKPEEPEPEPPKSPPPPPKASALPSYRGQARARLAVVATPPRDAAASSAVNDRGEVLDRLRDRAERRLARFFDRQGRVVVKRLTAPGRDRSLAAIQRRGCFDSLRWDDELAEEFAAVFGEMADEGLSTPAAPEAAAAANRATAEALDGIITKAVEDGRSVAEAAAAVTTWYAEWGVRHARELANDHVRAAEAPQENVA